MRVFVCVTLFLSRDTDFLEVKEVISRTHKIKTEILLIIDTEDWYTWDKYDELVDENPYFSKLNELPRKQKLKRKPKINRTQMSEWI